MNAIRSTEMTCTKLVHAREALRGIIRRESGLVIAPPGLGKSMAAVEESWDSICGSRKPAVVILAATTKVQRDDWTQFATRKGIPFVVIEGRNESNCDRFAIVKQVGELGHAPGRQVCTSCPHFKSPTNPCNYWKPINTALRRKGPFLIFCCHESVPAILTFFKKRRPTAVKALIFDESPHRAFIVDRQIRAINWQWPMGLNSYDLSPGSNDVDNRPDIDRQWNQIELGIQRLRKFDHCLRDVMRDALNYVHVATLCQDHPGGLRTCNLMQFLCSIAQHHRYDLADFISIQYASELERVIEYIFDRMMLAKALPEPGLMVPRHLPALIRALASDLDHFRKGEEDWNSSVRLVIGEHRRCSFIVTERMSLPWKPARILVLDGSGDLERTRLLFADPTIKEHRVEVPIHWKQLVHVKTNASRKRQSSKEGQRLVQHTVAAVKTVIAEGTLPATAELLVVTHGSRVNDKHKKALKEAIQGVFPGVVHCAHFAELRGRNDFRDVSVVVTVGDNEPPPIVVRDHYACLYLDESEPISLQMTENENGSRQLDDARLEHWRRLATVDEIAQSAFRCRPLDRPGQCIYMHVGSRWPTEHLGPADRIIDPRQDIDRQIVIEDFRKFVREHGWYSTVVGEIAGWHSVERAGITSTMSKAMKSEMLAELGLVDRTTDIKPFSARHFRDLTADVLDRLEVQIVMPPEFGMGDHPRLKVWGDKAAFMELLARVKQRLNAISASIGTNQNQESFAVTVPSDEVVRAILLSPVPMTLRRTLVSYWKRDEWDDQIVGFGDALIDILTKLFDVDSAKALYCPVTQVLESAYATGTQLNKNNELLARPPVTSSHQPSRNDPPRPNEASENDGPIHEPSKASTDGQLPRLTVSAVPGTEDRHRWQACHQEVATRWIQLSKHGHGNDVAVFDLLEPVLDHFELPECLFVAIRHLQIERNAAIERTTLAENSMPTESVECV